MDSGTVASTTPVVPAGSGGYDMGARRFGPDLGAFLQQDQFYGALADLGLATDPLTQNRYALAGGNPVSYVEWDGHAPTVDNPVSANPTQEGLDELWLVDVDQQLVLDRRPLASAAVGCHPLYHPDGRTIGLSIGEGQDGSLIRWARADRGRIELRLAQSIDRTLVDVHSSGAEYLSTPHGNTRADDLVRHRFVDDTPLEGLSAWEVFPFGGEWAFYAGI